MLPPDRHISVLVVSWEYTSVSLGIQEQSARAMFGLEDPDLGQIAADNQALEAPQIRLDLFLNLLTKPCQKMMNAIHSTTSMLLLP